MSDDRKEGVLLAKVDALVEENMTLAKEVKAKLDTLKKDNVDRKPEMEGSTTYQIAVNQLDVSCRRYQEAMTIHHDTLNGFRDALRNRSYRQLEIVDPSLTRMQVDELIDKGTAAQYVRQKLVSPGLIHVVEEIEARHLEIRKLEQDLQMVLQLFQDLSLLVDEQQEVLDSVQAHIERASVHTEKGEEELQKASKFQNKSRKTKFAIGATIAAILAVVIGPTAVAVVPALT